MSTKSPLEAANLCGLLATWTVMRRKNINGSMVTCGIGSDRRKTFKTSVAADVKGQLKTTASHTGNSCPARCWTQ